MLCIPKRKWGGGRLKITGVRWAESVRRRKTQGEVTVLTMKEKELAQQEYSNIAYKITPQGGIALPLDNRENAKLVEACYRTHDTTVNPIIDWTDAEVWEFIKEYKVPYCALYDQGYKRLGCIGCPMGSTQKQELDRYPKYKHLYMLAFEKMLKRLDDEDKRTTWHTAQDIMDWFTQTDNDANMSDTEIMGLIDEQ